LARGRWCPGAVSEPGWAAAHGRRVIGKRRVVCHNDLCPGPTGQACGDSGLGPFFRWRLFVGCSCAAPVAFWCLDLPPRRVAVWCGSRGWLKGGLWPPFWFLPLRLVGSCCTWVDPSISISLPSLLPIGWADNLHCLHRIHCTTFASKLAGQDTFNQPQRQVWFNIQTTTQNTSIQNHNHALPTALFPHCGHRGPGARQHRLDPPSRAGLCPRRALRASVRRGHRAS